MSSKNKRCPRWTGAPEVWMSRTFEHTVIKTETTHEYYWHHPLRYDGLWCKAFDGRPITLQDTLEWRRGAFKEGWKLVGVLK